MKITAKTNICMIIGDPVEHSLSPQMHNAGYDALGIDSEFVYTAARVSSENLQKAIEGIRAMNIHGVTCTIPHKIAVMEYLDSIDEHAQKIGAVNTILNDHGKLRGYNTDYIGVIKPLENITEIKNKHVAILGAGGFSHAAIYAMLLKEAHVTVFNRTLEKAKELAERFGCQYASLNDIQKIENMDIIINGTSVGMETNQSPLDKNVIHKEHIVFDAVYAPYETQLLKDAQEKGTKTIHGTEILLHQGFAQFELFTGHKAPEEVMRKVVMENI